MRPLEVTERSSLREGQWELTCWLASSVPVSVRRSCPYCTLSALLCGGLLFGLLFDPEEGGDIFLRNVGLPSSDYGIISQENRSLHQIKNKKFWEELIPYFPSYDTGHIENNASNNSSIVAPVFVNAVTFLPSHCLATIGGIFTEPLPSNDRGIHIQTQRLMRGMFLMRPSRWAQVP
jgi:hypothetical protein